LKVTSATKLLSGEEKLGETATNLYPDFFAEFRIQNIAAELIDPYSNALQFLQLLCPTSL
jgi:hypothetical protein